MEVARVSFQVAFAVSPAGQYTGPQRSNVLPQIPVGQDGRHSSSGVWGGRVAGEAGPARVPPNGGVGKGGVPESHAGAEDRLTGGDDLRVPEAARKTGPLRGTGGGDKAGKTGPG